MPAKKVLILTYYWPPAGGPGVQRCLKFSKYLGEFGWDPIIITPREGSYPYIDETLLNDIPPDLPVHKTKVKDPFRLYNFLQGKKGKAVPVAMTGIKDSKSIFQKLSKYIRANYFIPDARVGWNSFALKKANELIRETTIDAIITTGPPHSTHLVGLQLQKQHRLPWLADFRDPWTNIYYNRFLPRTKAVHAKDRQLEDTVLAGVDALTVVSKGLKQEFEDRCQNIHVIYNGFDEEDMVDNTPTVTERFSLSYIGNFKPNQDVPQLWQAIQELKNEIPAFGQDFELIFIGNIDPNIVQKQKTFGIDDLVRIKPFVPHQEATRLMAAANLLLFVIPEAEKNQLIITGKIFEYLASRTPLLSIGPPDGNAAELLNQANREAMMDYQDQVAIKQSLQKHYQAWRDQGKISPKVTDKSFQQFSRRGLTRQLSDILNQISL